MIENNNEPIFTGRGLSSHQPDSYHLENISAKRGLILGIVSLAVGNGLFFGGYIVILPFFEFAKYLISFMVIAGIVISLIAMITCIKAAIKGATSIKAIFGICIGIAGLLMNTFILLFICSIMRLKN